MDVVSTAGVPADERFALWREVSRKTWMPLDARCEPSAEGAFRAHAVFSGLGMAQTLLLTTTPLSVHRTPKLIRQADPEVFVLTCAVRGRVTGEQDGRRADLRAGDLMLRDSSRPYLTGHAPGNSTVRTLGLQVPRSLLPLPERDLRELTAVRISGGRGIGALSSRFLLHLAGHLHELTPADTARLSTVALDLLTAALAHELDAPGVLPSHTRRRALLARVHAFIQANLADPQLTPDAIAAAHHISLRYLHKLFREQGHTVSGWIRQCRLERCRRDLADPRLASYTITVIAARWGFTGPAHFSQAFRSAYGLSPRQFRQNATVRGG